MKIHQSFALVTLGLALILLFCTSRVLAQSVPEVVPHVVVVQFEAGVSLPAKTSTTGLQVFDRKAAAYGVHTIERMYPFLDHADPTPKTRRNLLAMRRTFYVRYNANVIPERVSSDLSLAPGIVYAEPVPVNRLQGSVRWERIDPNDPRFNEQPELELMRLPEAWDVVKSSDRIPRVVIATVDGGGEWLHEDLRANVWRNGGEIPGNGIDDDNNGFIDDVFGVNFANGDDTDNDPTGLPETPGSALHGTAVSGSACAVTNNNVGLAGAAWNAEIMHINAGCERDDLSICYGYQGILYAAMNGADIINVSWTSAVTEDRRVRHIGQALDLATDMGALVVAAASDDNVSNDLFRYYPARSPRVLSVGATEKVTRRRAGFSNYGRLVNVFAPGVDILTTGSENSYVSMDGTSFSSPLTAGVAALVKTRFPTMDPDALREHIRLTSESIDTENPGFAGQLGRGMVNALAAVQAPTLPAVRLKHWSWTDQDGDHRIAAGDVVTITATVVNYLSDATGLSVGLVGAERYPFLDMTIAEVEVGFLAGGDSTEIQFEFRVATDAPDNRRVRFYTRIQDGALEDGADQLSFQVNRSLEVLHRSLSAFYTATDGDNWKHNDNWDITRVPSEEELDTWFGVIFSEGLLSGLVMRSPNNLRGTLPPELENLRNLRTLYLSGNKGLTGPIPPELGNLAHLQELTLLSNSLSGSIPPELGNLAHLRVLWLFNNSLTGSIPPELGNLAQLQVLRLHFNSFSGSIPSELGSLETLRQLALSHNSLSGSIPPELGNLERLRELWLEYNSLSGSIPPELGNLGQLRGLILQNNSLSGSIPSELGNLEQLQQLRLFDNSLSGSIPPELGNLERLERLDLGQNSLSGSIPPEIGNLSQLEFLRLSGNAFTGQLPRSLMQLDNLSSFYFGGQSLCAPADDEFQMWLSSIPTGLGPTCRVLHFTRDIADQSFPLGLPITPFILPEAIRGISPVTYTLTPTLPVGLVYDSSTRTISGTPTVVTSGPIPYTFKATDSIGEADSLVFSIEVFSPVASEQEGLPESFTVHGNYPNPFRESTRLVVDLPWSATLNVEVFDVLGRRVLSPPPIDLTAGWSRSIRIEGTTLPSGLYLYRIRADSPVGIQRQAGRFLRVR
ncbi:MAG: S8 family serine peptidase [Bacteroidota bacterium]|nr:S8 family serine peptidase [Bacteroidota bacterium]